MSYAARRNWATIPGLYGKSAETPSINPQPEPEATPGPTEVPDVPSQPDGIIDASLMPTFQMIENFPYVGGNIFDASGHFDKNKFWRAVKQIYSNCPDY